MKDPQPHNEERLGRLVGLLAPAPEGWVQAAQEIPAFRRMLDDIVARAEADREFRQALIADLEAAIEQAGCAPEPRVVDEIRRRIGTDDGVSS